jgi:hypothetical protein
MGDGDQEICSTNISLVSFFHSKVILEKFTATKNEKNLLIYCLI